jgi:hypothetical protein
MKGSDNLHIGSDSFIRGNHDTTVGDRLNVQGDHIFMFRPNPMYYQSDNFKGGFRNRQNFPNKNSRRN